MKNLSTITKILFLALIAGQASDTLCMNFLSNWFSKKDKKQDSINDIYESIFPFMGEKDYKSLLNPWYSLNTNILENNCFDTPKIENLTKDQRKLIDGLSEMLISNKKVKNILSSLKLANLKFSSCYGQENHDYDSETIKKITQIEELLTKNKYHSDSNEKKDQKTIECIKKIIYLSALFNSMLLNQPTFCCGIENNFFFLAKGRLPISKKEETVAEKMTNLTTDIRYLSFSDIYKEKHKQVINNFFKRTKNIAKKLRQMKSLVFPFKLNHKRLEEKLIDCVVKTE